ncbi:MAG: N-hydroxyarylamine O-acetyltransferase [Sulfurimonas sp.]|jgi:N-hydroxyarylamine O-acetyltransferase
MEETIIKTLNTDEFKSYFEKLEVQPKELCLELVQTIQKKHLSTFSFNNIAVLLEKDISLEITNIVEKIVLKGLGGYCFEHNKLMHYALKSLGFNVRHVIARVINNQDIDVPRTHRITILEFENSLYLLDVGFGPTSPTAPIKIEESKKSTQKFRVRLNKSNNYQLEVYKNNAYICLYNFDLSIYTESDCILGNFYSHKHPEAIFVNNLVVSLIYDNKTLSLKNRIFLIKDVDAKEAINIHNYQLLYKILNYYFNIKINKKESEIIFAKLVD